jgi:hypothetical protein
MATVSSLENVPGESRHSYRGVVYVLRELSIGKFDDITKAATSPVLDADGNNLGDRLDTNLQMRMMLMACVKEPKDFSLDGLPSSVVFALNGNVNALHRPEEDELDPKNKAKGKGAPAADDSDGEAKGKA